MRALLLTFFLSLLGAGATAETKIEHWHRGWSVCFESTEFFLNRSEGAEGDCNVVEPLRLTEEFKYVDHNTVKARYWLGSYGRRYVTRDSYRRIVFNRCNGETVADDVVVRPTETIKSVAVENPNMTGDIADSYLLVPMTDAEAAAAFQQAKERCETTLR